MSIWKRIKRGFCEIWESMGEIPNCPACHGTGEPTGRWKCLAQQVYWKGQVVTVCHNCEGRGKV